jgi:uncharacterized membrane protein YfcA
MHDFSLVALALSCLVFACAYTVFGMTGFGQNIIAIPILVFMVPLKFCVPLIALLDSVFVTWTAAKFRKQANYTELMVLLPPLAVGLIAGATFLSLVPEHILLLCLGSLVTLYGIYSLLKGERTVRLKQLAAVPLGFFGGLMSAAFGTGGPVNVMYLAGRISDKSDLRASILIVLILSTAMRLVIFGLTDFLENRLLWVWWLSVLPFCFAGVQLGHYLHDRINSVMMLLIVRIVLTFSGLMLVFKNIHVVI